MTPSRPVPEILRDAEALGVQGPGFDDPEAELERLQNTPRKLLAEVTASGALAIPELVAALATAQGYPDQVGFRDRRAFVCLALGRVAHHDTAATFAAWASASEPDQRRVLESVRAGEQTNAVLAAWRTASDESQRALLDAR